LNQLSSFDVLAGWQFRKPRHFSVQGCEGRQPVVSQAEQGSVLASVSHQHERFL